MLQVETDLAIFIEKVRPHLENNSSINSIVLSVLNRFIKSNKPLTFLGTTSEIVGIQTNNENPLILSHCFEKDAQYFAEELFKLKIKIPGVNSTAFASDAFAKTWCRLSGQTMKIGMNIRLYELTKVIFPQQVSGNCRLATSFDESILFDWYKRYCEEALPSDPLPADEMILKTIRQNIADQNYYLWEDHGQTISWVGSSRETKRERWIAPVYTPKHFRGKGHASALVAEVSQTILNKSKVALLTTNLANPTSNSIYQKIGYKPLTDFRHWIFEEKAEPKA